MKEKFKSLSRYVILFIILTTSISTSLFIMNSCEKDADKFSNNDIGAQESEGNTEDATDYSNDQVIAALQNSYRKIAKSSLPGVVHITSTIEQEAPQMPFWFPFQQNTPSTREVEVYGSGFIISNDGYILTNNHVIADAKNVKVLLTDGSEFTGEVLGTDPDIDVAMIKIDPGKKKLPTLKLGDSDDLKVGDIIIAIGNPFGLDGTVTQGIVAAKGRVNIGVNKYEDFIQIDAAINPGNSGGPLLNIKGEVIGINDAIISKTGQYAGIGLAIPINIVKTILSNLKENKPIERGYLGVTIQPMDENMAEYYELDEVKGIAVTGVEKGSPADKAGIKVKDVIIEYDGKTIKDPKQFINYIGLSAVGKEIELKIVRMKFGKKQVLTVKVEIMKRTVASIGDQMDNNWMGVKAVSLNDENRQKYNAYGATKGVIISYMDSDSIAAKAGIKKGDVITQLNDYDIDSLETFYEAIDKLENSKKILILLKRRGASIMLSFTK